MRTSGRDSDLTVIVVPVVLLLVAAAALTGNPRPFFSSLERQLWHGVEAASRWLASLFS